MPVNKSTSKTSHYIDQTATQTQKKIKINENTAAPASRANPQAQLMTGTTITQHLDHPSLAPVFTTYRKATASEKQTQGTIREIKPGLYVSHKVDDQENIIFFAQEKMDFLKSETWDDIKASFEAYFKNRHIKGYRHKNLSFYDFECYPRLNFSEQSITSDFISAFLKKLTNPSTENPFYEYYCLEDKTNSKIARNFEVLSSQYFQSQLIALFGLARLMEEQFLIPRIFVDFIFQIMTKEHEDGIIGNVFSELDNEFSQCFNKVDPVNTRSRELDNFYLEYATNTLSEDIVDDISQLNSFTGCCLSPQGIIRGAFLLNGHNLKSSLPNFYHSSYLQIALKHYLRLISVYETFELSDKDEDDCLNIIEDLIVKSALTYANRQLPIPVDGFIVSRKLSEYSVCNKINIQADIDSIERHQLISKDIIPIPLIINNEAVYIFNLDLKTLVQAVYISNGFRPNRQNIEAIAKFDELLVHIVERTLESESLKLISRDKIVSINKNRRRFTVEV
mgnify:CR=1 FL=1